MCNCVLFCCIAKASCKFSDFLKQKDALEGFFFYNSRMTEKHSIESITHRLLTLWQEQVSLMAQDPEMLSYGDSLFKAMGMPSPSKDMTTTEEDIDGDQRATNDGTEDRNESNPSSEINRPAQSDGAAPDALSPEQHATMVDELSRRINELAIQIAEHEGKSVSPDAQG